MSPRFRVTPPALRLGALALGAAVLLSAPAAAAERSGKEVYDSYCQTCHLTGVAGAPKLSDKAAWKPRVDKGEATLLEHTRQGFNAHPPMGTCMDCSDEELRGALEYMLEQVR